MTADAPALECSILIRHALLLRPGSTPLLLEDQAIAIGDDRILAIGDDPLIAPRYRQALRTIDASRRLLMPGLVNSHNHTPLMITRGMVEDLSFAPMYTPSIPQGHWLSHEECEMLALLGVFELLRSGSTTIADYYRHPQALAAAHARLGTRAVIAGRVHDVDPAALAQGRHEWRTEIGEQTLEESALLIEQWDQHDRGRIRCDWAPHAPDTCSRPLLARVADLAQRHGGNIHTHLAQSRAEVRVVHERDGISPTELLDATGLLGPSTIAAHCIHLSDADVLRCGQAGISVAHSPIGNARAGDIAPILQLQEAGARISLCTDTMSGDLIEAMRWAVSMQRVRAQEFVLDAASVLEWATLGGARVLGLQDSVGKLEPGFKADLLLLDLDSPSLAPMIDGAGILVHSGSGKDVHTVIIDGRVVLEDGLPTLADGPALLQQAQACAARLWRKAGRSVPSL